VVGLALALTGVLTGWLVCAGATGAEPPVITLAAGVGVCDWLGLGEGAVDARAAGAAVVGGGGATGAAVVGTGTGTDEM
jgi:hypothetical protein